MHTQRAVNTIKRKNVSEKVKIQAYFKLYTLFTLHVYTLFTKLRKPLNDEIFKEKVVCEDPVTMAAIQVRTNLTSENRLRHIRIARELAES